MNRQILLFRGLFCILLFLLAGIVHAQFVPEPYTGIHHKDESPKITLKSSENIIWYEDFNGSLPETWTSVDLSGYCSFQHSYQGPQGPLSIGMPALNSTTAENGFMLLDSDLCDAQGNAGLTDAYLESPSIDLSDFENVMLRFQHSFRYCCSPEQTMLAVEVSNDNENWVVFDVRNGLPPNNTSPNPRIQSVNISQVAGGEELVWIRFRKTGASHYWWMIDDVMLLSFIENDLEIKGLEINNGYTQIPSGQQQPFVFKSIVRNVGGMNQTQVVFNAQVNTYLFDDSSLPYPVIEPGHDKVLSVNNEFVMPGRGVYNVELSIDQDQTDQVPENNYYATQLIVTDSIYSRSTNTYQSVFRIPGVEEMAEEIANRFTVYDSIEATSISFVLHEDAIAGTEVSVKLYKETDLGFIEIAESTNYAISQDDVSNEENLVWVSIPLDSVTAISAGEYLAAVNTSSTGLVIAAQDLSFFQPLNTSFWYQDDNWHLLELTPMINLNFGNNVGECAPMYHFITEHALCGTNTGSVEVFPLTGIGPYVYLWEDFSENDTSVVDSLSSGEYNLTITDGYGCVWEQQVVIEDADLELDYEMIPASCGHNGTITVIPSNGDEPFTYSWAHDTNVDSASVSGLTPGSYTVTVTDANNCQGILTVDVEDSTDLKVEVKVQDAYCDDSVGEIELTTITGAEPFVYSWDGFVDVTGNVLTGLSAGTYHFTVTDDNNCSYQGQATIIDESYTLDVSYTVMDASCGLNNGYVSLNIPNGQSPYSFSWSNGLQSSTIENLAPGSYSVAVKDTFGCVGDATVVVDNEGTMPLVTWNVENSPNCGESNGSIQIIQDNPNDIYVYTLLSENEETGEDNKSQNDYFHFKNDEGFFAGNLLAGHYLVHIVNDQGCEKTIAADISDQNSPDIIYNNESIKNITCFGEVNGSISINIENPGSNPQLLWNDSNNSTTPSIDNLAAGLYTLKVTNDEGCLSVASFEIKEPAMLLANAVVTHNVCAYDNKGSIHLSVSGGTRPVSFIWNTGETERNLENISAGNYNVTITDYQLCTFSNSYQLNSPEEIKLSYVAEDPVDEQNNGSILLTVTGGVGSYTYTWDSGQDTPLISDLPAGSYTITVSDANECVQTETIHLGNVDVLDYNIEEAIRLYPNPVSKELNLSLRTSCSNVFLVEIYNVIGEQIPTNLFNTSYQAEENLKINVESLVPGIYIVRLRCKENIWQAKFVKN